MTLDVFQKQHGMSVGSREGRALLSCIFIHDTVRAGSRPFAAPLSEMNLGPPFANFLKHRWFQNIIHNVSRLKSVTTAATLFEINFII